MAANETSDQLTELACDLEARSGTYAFLACAFSDDEVTGAFLASLAAGAPETGTALDDYARSLAGLDADGIEDARRELAAEHTNLLLGMSRRFVSPYESVHTSEEHLLMQQARDEVVAAYAAGGFAKDGGRHVPEDHVSLELDFCAALLARAAASVRLVLDGGADEALEAGRDPLASAERDMNAQADFARTHLLRWAFGFCDLVETRARDDFYRGCAQMLRAFLEEERAYLDELEGAACAFRAAA